MRIMPELVDAVKTNFRRAPKAGAVGTIRVDVKHQEQKTLEAVHKEEDKAFQFIADEPASRGGTSRGPSPLSYFVGGGAT